MKATVRSGACMVFATAMMWTTASAPAAERLTPATANPCTAGDKLLKTHRLADASAFYDAALEKRPGLTCAQLGLAAVAGKHAVALKKRQEGNDAVAKAARQRKRAKDLEAAAAGQAAEEAAAAVRQDAIAKAAYTQALAHNADIKGPATALARLTPPKKKDSRPARLGGWIDRTGKSIKKNIFDRADDAGRIVVLGAAIFLALAILAALVLRGLTASKGFGRWMHHRRFIGRMAHRPLVVGKIDDDKDEAGLVWQLRDAIGNASSPHGHSVDLSTGTSESEKLLEGVGGALAKLPQATLVTEGWRLIRLLVSRAPLVVEGKSLPRGRRGVGLSLTVARGRHVMRTITLWQQTYELGPLPAAAEGEGEDKVNPPWERLAIAGAAWAQYVWLESLGGRELTRSLGTDDWQSYAYLQVGLEVLTRDAERDLAQALFALAVDRDPGNRLALFNLAVVDRRRDEPQQAIERLSSLERELVR